MKTLYDLLEIRPDADPETVKRAFRRAVRAHHPDLRGDAADNHRLRVVIAANRVLRDPEQRAAYDRHLELKRRRSRSQRWRTIRRFALDVMVLSLISIGGAEVWLASTMVPRGKAVLTTQQRDDVVASARASPPAQPEQEPATVRSAAADAQSPAEISPREAAAPPPPSTHETAGGIAEPVPVADAPTAAPSAAVPPLTTASAYRERAIDAMQRGNLDQAIADLDRAIELDPDDAEAHHQRGNAWARKGDTDRALLDYDQAIEIDPHDSVMFHDRGLIWQQKKQLDKALADLDRAVRMSFAEPEVYCDRGAVWFAKGGDDRALADLDRAIKLNPKLVIAYLRRAAVFEHKGDQERAQADRDQASRLDRASAGNIAPAVGSDFSGDH